MSNTDLAAGPFPADGSEAAPRGGPDRYRCADVDVVPVGNDLVLAREKVAGSVHVLEATDAQLLALCQPFRTLDDHAWGCLKQLRRGPDQLPIVREALSRLAARGLLLAHRDVLTACRHNGGSPRPLQVAAVCIPTYNDPRSLNRALAGYIANALDHGRYPDFVVFDNSLDPDIRDRNRAALRSLRRRSGASLRYAGLEEKTRFARLLTDASGAPARVADYALFDREDTGLITVGANRNALLLHGVDGALLCADDDTICRVGEAVGSVAGLILASDADPCDLEFFPSLQAARRSVPGVDCDLLALHERFLGCDTARCVATAAVDAAADLDAASPEFLRHVAGGRGRVLVTINGVVGDCAWGQPDGYIVLPGVKLARLIQSEEAYVAAFGSRQVVRRVHRPTLSDRLELLMTICVGLDNRAILPPFLPVGRGEDRVFGVLVNRCLPGAHCAHLPWTVDHAPIEARAFTEADIAATSGQYRLDGFLVILVNLLGTSLIAPDAEGRIKRLGQTLASLGEISPAELEEMLKVHVWRSWSGRLTSVDRCLRAAGAGAPETWARNARRYLQEGRAALADGRASLPRDLREGRSPEQARNLMHRLVTAFGELLWWWPDLVKAARALRAQGESLARPV